MQVSSVSETSDVRPGQFYNSVEPVRRKTSLNYTGGPHGTGARSYKTHRDHSGHLRSGIPTPAHGSPRRYPENMELQFGHLLAQYENRKVVGDKIGHLGEQSDNGDRME